MNRELYPDNWEEISAEKKKSTGWKCEACRKQCYRPGDEVVTRRDVLTVAHLDHNPANCEAENLRALCAQCHLRYDAATRRQRRSADWQAMCLGRVRGQSQLEFFS